jgi:hypothetical protein
MGKAIGASGNVDAMAAALAKYKEVKGEVLTPPPAKVIFINNNCKYLFLTLLEFDSHDGPISKIS